MNPASPALSCPSQAELGEAALPVVLIFWIPPASQSSSLCRVSECTGSDTCFYYVCRWTDESYLCAEYFKARRVNWTLIFWMIKITNLWLRIISMQHQVRIRREKSPWMYFHASEKADTERSYSKDMGEKSEKDWIWLRWHIQWMIRTDVMNLNERQSNKTACMHFYMEI